MAFRLRRKASVSASLVCYTESMQKYWAAMICGIVIAEIAFAVYATSALGFFYSLLGVGLFLTTSGFVGINQRRSG